MKPTIPRGSSPQSLTTRYSKFVGVDFASEPTTMETVRSPMAPNLIAGQGGYPEKRLGYRAVYADDALASEPDETRADNSDLITPVITKLFRSLFVGIPDGVLELLVMAFAEEHKAANGIKSLHRAVISGTEYLLAQRGTQLVKWTKTGTITALGHIHTPVDYPSDLLTEINEDFETLIGTYTAGGVVSWSALELSLEWKAVRNKCLSAAQAAETRREEMGAATSVFLNGKLWILSGSDYYVFDGSTLKAVTETAYTPTVVISADPKTAGGVAHEPYNLLQPKFTMAYVGDAETTAYKIGQKFDASKGATVKVNGTTLATGYSLNGTTGTVTFDTAPAKPQVVGQDNVEITVTRSDYSDSSIQGCRVMGLFGLGGADTDRIFFTGNPDKPNVDWHCDISAPDYNVDPTYIPDTSFAYIGAEQNPIMGYRRLGAYQVIIKGANDQDASVYLRSAALDIDGNTAFGIQQGAAGQGAVAMKSFANLGDDPLFLGANGIMGISNLDVTALASIQNRSFFVNPLLTQERDLSKAIAVEWRGCYVLAVNNRCYVLDGSQHRNLDPRSGSNAIYECYYWTNIPATCFCEVDGELYFGSEDGTIYEFATNEYDNSNKYTDHGMAIDAWWASKPDDDGDYSVYKSTLRSGCYIMIKPKTNGRLQIYTFTHRNTENAITDNDPFSGVTPETIEFAERAGVIAYPAARKAKKYITLQFVVRNNENGEDFGMAAITKKFIYGGNIKGSARVASGDDNGGGDDDDPPIVET